MSVVLIGYRGSGKTTVGKLLAQRLGWNFIDSDEQIVNRAGKSIKLIFEQDGESKFRQLESQIVGELMQLAKHVISLGGGAVLAEENRHAIAQGGVTVIYLKSDAKTLHDRIHADAATANQRPALTHLGGTLDEIRTLLSSREPIYRQVMTHEIDASASPDQVVDKILANLREHRPIRNARD